MKSSEPHWLDVSAYIEYLFWGQDVQDPVDSIVKEIVRDVLISVEIPPSEVWDIHCDKAGKVFFVNMLTGGKDWLMPMEPDMYCLMKYLYQFAHCLTSPTLMSIQLNGIHQSFLGVDAASVLKVVNPYQSLPSRDKIRTGVVSILWTRFQFLKRVWQITVGEKYEGSVGGLMSLIPLSDEDVKNHFASVASDLIPYYLKNDCEVLREYLTLVNVVEGSEVQVDVHAGSAQGTETSATREIAKKYLDLVYEYVLCEICAKHVNYMTSASPSEILNVSLNDTGLQCVDLVRHALEQVEETKTQPPGNIVDDNISPCVADEDVDILSSLGSSLSSEGLNVALCEEAIESATLFPQVCARACLEDIYVSCWFFIEQRSLRRDSRRQEICTAYLPHATIPYMATTGLDLSSLSQVVNFTTDSIRTAASEPRHVSPERILELFRVGVREVLAIELDSWVPGSPTKWPFPVVNEEDPFWSLSAFLRESIVKVVLVESYHKATCPPLENLELVIVDINRLREDAESKHTSRQGTQSAGNGGCVSSMQGAAPNESRRLLNQCYSVTQWISRNRRKLMHHHSDELPSGPVPQDDSDLSSCTDSGCERPGVVEPVAKRALSVTSGCMSRPCTPVDNTSYIPGYLESFKHVRRSRWSELWAGSKRVASARGHLQVNQARRRMEERYSASFIEGVTSLRLCESARGTITPSPGVIEYMYNRPRVCALCNRVYQFLCGAFGGLQAAFHAIDAANKSRINCGQFAHGVLTLGGAAAGISQDDARWLEATINGLFF